MESGERKGTQRMRLGIEGWSLVGEGNTENEVGEDGVWWEKGNTENEVGEGWSLVRERDTE